MLYELPSERGENMVWVSIKVEIWMEWLSLDKKWLKDRAPRVASYSEHAAWSQQVAGKNFCFRLYTSYVGENRPVYINNDLIFVI